MVVRKEFDVRKEGVLRSLASEAIDKSRKGGVDAPIVDLISSINCHPSFFTTSSCSGRISVSVEPCSGSQPRSDSEGKERKVKKGGDWIFISHEPAEPNEVICAVRQKYEEAQEEGLLVFRFEPFILALECSSLAAAQQLVICAHGSGYRESGISSVGKRIVVGVRSSIRLEVPIGDRGQIIVPDEYLRYLTVMANKKFSLNEKRIQRFSMAFEQVGCEIRQPQDSNAVYLEALSSKGGHRVGKRMSSEGVGKLLSCLEKRQSNIMARINSLETLQGGGSYSTVQDKLASLENRQSEILIRINYLKALPSSLRGPDKRACEANDLVSGALIDSLFRWGHSTCKTGKQSIMLFGGYGGPDRHARLNDLVELDIKDRCVRSVRADGTPHPMMAHTGARVADNMVVIGGRRSPNVILSTVSVLDFKSLKWNYPRISGASFPARHRHAAAVVGSQIYVHGGLNESGTLGDLYVLDTTSWIWTVVNCRGKLPSARHSHAIVAIGTKLYLFGGREGNTIYEDLHAFDMKTLVWTGVKAEGICPSPRFSHTMTAISHFIAVIGGCPITTQGPDLVFLDVSSMRWVRVQVLWPRERLLVRHSATLVGDSLVVVGGGAACFAFGTSFSPTFVLNLKPFLEQVEYLEDKHQARMGPSNELSWDSRENSLQELMSWVLKVDKSKAKVTKDALKQLNWLDRRRKSKILDEGNYVAFPILEVALNVLMKDGHQEQVYSIDKDSSTVADVRKCNIDEVLGILLRCGGEVLKVEVLPDIRSHKSPMNVLQKGVAAVLEQNNLSLCLLDELPKKWERLGDMVVLPPGSLCSSAWSKLGEQLWRTIAVSLNASRLARQAPIASTGTRDSQLHLLYGLDGWVEHRENGILYCFDATKCMFSSGNVSEKLRLASMSCKGATVVDLFAGIGYYILPFLLKAGVQKAYACEWNPHAIVALRHNLRVNGVEHMCEVIEGDNRSMAPQGVADIVSLGLLPTSEGSWPVAVRALKREGGLLLVHGNVKDTEEREWIDHLLMSISTLAASTGLAWDVYIIHLERVKWYAPHIRHVVADICCKQSQGS